MERFRISNNSFLKALEGGGKPMVDGVRRGDQKCGKQKVRVKTW